MGISVSIASDMSEVNAFIKIDSIWQRFALGYTDPDEYYPGDSKYENWLLIKCSNCDTVGVIYAHVETNCSMRMHLYIVRSHRSIARESAHLFFAWFLAYAERRMVRLTIAIPEYFKSAINSALKAGFTKYGIDPLSHREGNILFDTALLGVTREDMPSIIERGYEEN